MQKKLLIITLFISATLAFSNANARKGGFDKTPNENKKTMLNAAKSTITMEKAIQELLKETKKNNKLLQQLIDSNESNR